MVFFVQESLPGRVCSLLRVGFMSDRSGVINYQLEPSLHKLAHGDESSCWSDPGRREPRARLG